MYKRIREMDGLIRVTWMKTILPSLAQVLKVTPAQPPVIQYMTSTGNTGDNILNDLNEEIQDLPSSKLGTKE